MYFSSTDLVDLMHLLSPYPSTRGRWGGERNGDDILWYFCVCKFGQNLFLNYVNLCQGRQGKRWDGNIRVWTGLEFAKSPRAVENGKMEETGCKIICDAPVTLEVPG